MLVLLLTFFVPSTASPLSHRVRKFNFKFSLKSIFIPRRYIYILNPQQDLAGKIIIDYTQGIVHLL